MRARNLVQLLGIRGGARHYPYEMVPYEIGQGETVRFPQWTHPAESTKVMTPRLVDAYRALISEGDFCVDIGAHSGDTALPMAVAAGRTGCVLALEPNPFVYPVLEKTRRANAHLTHIQTIMAAAAAEEGFMEFEYSDSGYCNGGRHHGISPFRHGHAFKLKVFAINLEAELRSDFAALLPRLRFIKVDAEGYDLEVLKSIEGVVREFRPVIKAEVFKKTDRAYREGMLEYFRGLDYSVKKIREDPLAEGADLTMESLGAGEHYDILARPAENT